MPFPATNIPNRAAGEFIDDPDWDELVDALNFLANRPACRVHHSAAQSITNNTETALAFNSERYDTAAMHDTATNNSRITITTAGLYVITGHIDFAANATGIRQVGIRLNGATYVALTLATAPASSDAIISVAATYKLAVADYVQLVVYQNSGVALNINAAGNYSPEFTATWLGRG